MAKNGYEAADAPPLDPIHARKTADELAKILFTIQAESGEQMKVVRTAGELESYLRDGVLAAVLHFGGAENLDLDPGALEDLCEVGLRSLVSSCGADKTPTGPKYPSGRQLPRIRGPAWRTRGGSSCASATGWASCSTFRT
jgi:hypothetical protein